MTTLITNENKNEIYENTPIKKTKNSLIELFRFLFAIWIVYHHGFFIFPEHHIFLGGYIGVEFFFAINGLFLISSINKYKDLPLFKALWRFLVDKVKVLGIPFLISLIFVVWYMALNPVLEFFGYMWYVPCMLITFIVMFLLHRTIKKRAIFISILVFFIVVSYVILYIPILWGVGILRAFAAISIGIIISYMKKVNLRFKFLNLNVIITIILSIALFILAYLPKPDLNCERLLALVVIPLLVYFINTLKFSNKFLNFLGTFAFPLYAYQCVLRVLRVLCPLAPYFYFIILIGIVAVNKVVEILLKKRKLKKQMANLPV